MKRFPFAPGVIEVARTTRADAISRCVMVLACLVALAAVIGVASGCITLPGWSL
jgi:hypothetical protein